jgi:hypothetical protein
MKITGNFAESLRKVSGKFPETLGSETLRPETFPHAVLPLLFSLKRQILQFFRLGMLQFIYPVI